MAFEFTQVGDPVNGVSSFHALSSGDKTFSHGGIGKVNRNPIEDFQGTRLCAQSGGEATCMWWATYENPGRPGAQVASSDVKGGISNQPDDPFVTQTP